MRTAIRPSCAMSWFTPNQSIQLVTDCRKLFKGMPTFATFREQVRTPLNLSLPRIGFPTTTSGCPSYEPVATEVIAIQGNFMMFTRISFFGCAEAGSTPGRNGMQVMRYLPDEPCPAVSESTVLFPSSEVLTTYKWSHFKRRRPKN